MKFACTPAAALIACWLASTATAMAQTSPGSPPPTAPPATTPPAASQSISLTLEQRHVIRELISELKTPAATVDKKLAAGDGVPDGVSPQPVPPLVGNKVPQVKSHRFFVVGKQIALVDPTENRIVEVID